MNNPDIKTYKTRQIKKLIAASCIISESLASNHETIATIITEIQINKQDKLQTLSQ